MVRDSIFVEDDESRRLANPDDRFACPASPQARTASATKGLVRVWPSNGSGLLLTSRALVLSAMRRRQQRCAGSIPATNAASPGGWEAVLLRGTAGSGIEMSRGWRVRYSADVRAVHRYGAYGAGVPFAAVRDGGADKSVRYRYCCARRTPSADLFGAVIYREPEQLTIAS